mmetsp:Transcript_47482/g.111045  ORF Transcript_47482/g.111045 Transcript_47482/m.111045 type:complete len:240 (-) Transcript_47482:87-806(-)
MASVRGPGFAKSGQRAVRLVAVALGACLLPGAPGFFARTPSSFHAPSRAHFSSSVRPDDKAHEGVPKHVGAIGAAATAVLIGCLAFLPSPALAESKRVVGEIPASGFVFKDTINVEAFEDPKVSGVSLYISDFSRSLADRMSKGDFFSDPGAAGLTCTKNGPVKIAADLKPSKEGEDVFQESRAILFKTLKVKRIYDADAKNILYVAFTERLDSNNDSNKSRFKSQVCGVHVDGVADKA